MFVEGLLLFGKVRAGSMTHGGASTDLSLHMAAGYLIIAGYFPGLDL